MATDEHTRKLFAYVISRAATNRKNVELWQHVCALEPTYSNMIHLGIEYERRKQFQSAMKAYFVASKMAPHKYGARYRIGKIHFAQCRYKHASLHFREALMLIRQDSHANGRLFKDNILASYRLNCVWLGFVAHIELALGVALLNTGEYHAALAVLEKQKARFEFKPVLALLYLLQGEFLRSVQRWEAKLSDTIIGSHMEALNVMFVGSNHEEEDARLLAVMHYTAFLLVRTYMPGKMRWFEAECLDACLKAHPGHERAKEERATLLSDSLAQEGHRCLEDELSAVLVKFLENSPADINQSMLEQELKSKEVFSLKDLSAVEGMSVYGRSIQELLRFFQGTNEPKGRKKQLARMRSCPLPSANSTEIHGGKHFIDAIKLRRSNLYTEELSDDSGDDFA